MFFCKNMSKYVTVLKFKIIFSHFLNSMIMKNDLDPRKLVVNCQPYIGQQLTLKVVAELLHCVNLFNSKKCKLITIVDTNQLTNDEIYKWLKTYSSHVIFYRQQIDGKLNNRVSAYITAQVIPNGIFKVSSYKYFSVFN